MNEIEVIKNAAEIGTTAYLIQQLGGKELVAKLLGPTADYLSLFPPFLIKKSIENIAHVFKFAVKKLGTKNDELASVPSRLLKDIVIEAAFCENVLMAEYFGGILAASRTKEGNNDRGIVLTSLIKSMSAIQIRAHYVLYSLVRNLFNGKQGINIGISEGRNKLKTFVPLSIFENAMNNLTANDLDHIFFGLSRNELIEPTNGWVFGNVNELKKHYPLANEDGIIFSPSALGTELFLWAHGYSDSNIRQILDPELNLKFINEISIFPGSVPVNG